ncbi:helix-turn-helix domain-containing protein [Actinoplanes sp. NPDC051851]|uniref:TetR/AcrR family transcriptional regulator n=1 Tax=Actinoplanes sp. NPDC051851 TaxID=3154753 RepID=UPI003442C270
MPETAAPKATRILAAAGELLLGRGSRGVTIADVARRAHIGKGTVYLYWKTKEDLLLDLVCRDFLALADEITAAVTDDPELARPSRMCPNMLRMSAEHPYVSALQVNDAELLGVLIEDPRSASLLEALGPVAVMHQLLPIWRDHDLAGTDWALPDQALALQALISGFIIVKPDAADVLAAAVTALLGPERATSDQVRGAAERGLRSLDEQRALVRELMSRPV